MPQPLFFGDATSQLFGIYHPPTGNPSQKAVVLCNPLGQEFMRAHRCLRQIAVRLSNSGIHAFRFDYAGSGDSAGELADTSVEIWTQNIVQAIEELKAMSMVRQVSLIGLRLGATLATKACAGRTDIDQLLLWDPLADGNQYLDDLEQVHERMLEDLDRYPVVRSSDDCEQNELLGFRLPETLAAGIRSLTLDALADAGQVRRSCIVNSASESLPESATCRTSLLGSAPELINIEENLGWSDEKAIKSALIPHQSVEAIANWVAS